LSHVPLAICCISFAFTDAAPAVSAAASFVRCFLALLHERFEGLGAFLSRPHECADAREPDLVRRIENRLREILRSSRGISLRRGFLGFLQHRRSP
jgi:hypothetical protein